MEPGSLISVSNALDLVPSFTTSLVIGLLIGLERERSPAAKAGLRTFTLTALPGTMLALPTQKTGSPLILIGAAGSGSDDHQRLHG